MKVVSGAQEGVTGMVLTVEGHLVNIVSDTTKEVVRIKSLLAMTFLFNGKPLFVTDTCHPIPATCFL